MNDEWLIIESISLLKNSKPRLFVDLYTHMALINTPVEQDIQ